MRWLLTPAPDGEARPIVAMVLLFAAICVAYLAMPPVMP